MRKLLYIDSSFSLSQIRERGLDHVLAIRMLEGFFDKVWSAHPIDTHPALSNDVPPAGKPLVEEVAPDHIFLRGRYGRFKSPGWFAPLNILLGLISFTWELARLARREDIDTIRAGDPVLCGIIGLCVARISRAKFVVRIPANNDMIRASTGEPIYTLFTRSMAVEQWLEKVVISRADVIIAPSHNYADFAVSKGARRENIHLVRYGAMIDPKHKLLPEDRPAPGFSRHSVRLFERPWMTHIGRLVKLKHVEDCFDVLEQLATEGMDVGLMLIGDGPLREKLEARVAAAGLGDRVVFLGNLAQDELLALLPHAAVVLSPLTGRALAEAAFAACPIVAYDLDWQGELIREGETGILVSPRDSAAMAAGARRMLVDADFAKAMGQAARVRAMALLSPEVAHASERAAYNVLGVPE